MKDICWLTEEMIRNIHDDQIAEYGGLPGIRDYNLLMASLDRPKNLYMYEQITLFDLAGAYAFAFAKNHAFIDGNKRVAFAALTTFLAMNGYWLKTTCNDAEERIIRLANNEETQKSISDWISSKCVRFNLD